MKNWSLQRTDFKKVEQYDLDGNFIKTWDSAIFAAKELNIRNKIICECCNGRKPTYKGFNCCI